jgi:hypothetical protein
MHIYWALFTVGLLFWFIQFAGVVLGYRQQRNPAIYLHPLLAVITKDKFKRKIDIALGIYLFLLAAYYMLAHSYKKAVVVFLIGVFMVVPFARRRTANP